MSGRELIRHLHMGCGEPLKTVMPYKKADKKVVPKEQNSLDSCKAKKSYPAN